MNISRNAMEVATALVTALAGAAVCYGAMENGIGWTESGPKPGYFPFAIGCLILIGSTATLGQVAWKSLAAGPAGESGHADSFINGPGLRTLAAFFLPIVAMTAISAWLGLYIGMALYIFYAMYFAAGFRLYSSLLTTVIVVAANFIVFEKLFMVPLLKGPILEYFGIY
ncbi:tripartite tricarboxylate transporter TctB family protein [Starkeya koreensis]|uniref:Tripartite tricarboxylate transporter TctB family protein n=1 Tax=Ancylobacter koreensis TaxID=266121 RepID=A0ABT0DJA4_9HYPH|nr:tripartite tricarboxylate transporter TctB family protein [Ancylobacter koreensis]MCK0207351.1 tripartite tricarboxylate transporter TctB family protein [Ancylobacter koreensis]